MKWTLAGLAALAVAAFLPPAFNTGATVAAAATPTPAALQYDELTRMVIPPATPPAPGTFAADYQVAASATPIPKLPSLNFGMMINPAAAKKYADQMQAMAAQVRVTRYTFYRGWIRREDPVARTAEIEKCDRHQYIKLDLANKTYTSISAEAACATPQAAMPGPPQASGEAGGTVDLVTTVTNTDLGPMTLDGIPTTGFDRSVELKLTNATGSCRDGDLKMTVRQYVSNVKVPHRFCPLPKGMNPLSAAGSSPGCKPKIAGLENGNFSIDTMGVDVGSLDNLVMFSRLSADVGGRGAGFGMFVERGNVRWFGGQDAEALFVIPPGFTQTSGS
ncbi:MAG TPA: hypothetical protein VFU90_10885 [Candidatus Tumulicola sp.]|nr:hypothetical protein [Candidatus Tumulicola sp.]